MFKTIGIILAAGKGTRLNCRSINKTILSFNGKPLIQYGVDLYSQITDTTVIVVGAFANSIKHVLRRPAGVYYAHQTKRLGTGHAVKVAVNQIEKLKVKPQTVLIGYGDHMMFYTPKILKNLIDQHIVHQASVSLLSTHFSDPDYLAWGRIIKGKNGELERIVEQKDASVSERKITEVNPGFYCVDYEFLKIALKKLKKSAISGEYYLTDIIEIAKNMQKTVIAVPVPFHFVGIGINTHEQLQQSQELHKTNLSI